MNESLYIIGNGFDLHHSLPTSYGDYRKFLQGWHPEFVDRVDEMFYMNGAPKEKIELWSGLEELTRDFPNLDYETMHDDAFDSAEQDMDRASYWHDPQYIAEGFGEKWIGFYEKFTGCFKEWVDSVTISNASKDERLDVAPDGSFLNFNYTRTLEVLYGVPSDRIMYIHVDDGKYLFGNNMPPEIPYPNPEGIYIDENGRETSDEDIRNVEVRKSLNETYMSIHGTYFKDSASRIRKNSAWFSQMGGFRRVSFMGFSFGKEDEIYVEYIFQNAVNCKEWIIYYHTDQDYERAEYYTKKFDAQNAEFKKW